MTVNLRRSLGIGTDSSLSVTLTDLSQIAADSPYIMALTEILKRFPGHFHLFAGPGDVKRVRARLHAEGVLPRVRFLGNMADAEPLLTACDLYLAYFNSSGDEAEQTGIAIGGKPSVILSKGDADEATLQHNARTVSDYVEAACRLIRNSARTH